MKIVILAGGSGTRLWPMSRRNSPKQFSKVMGKKTLLEITLNRFKKEYSLDKIYISTTPGYYKNVIKILPDFKVQNIIVEPEKRDTAAAMGYVAAVLSVDDPSEPLAFVASDHYIKDNNLFLQTLEIAEAEIKRTGKLLDIGIVPEYPSTALGYTRIGAQVRTEKGIEIYEFLGHKEKPSYKVAQKYFDKREYLWHGNFYMWTPEMFLEAFKKYAPEVYKPLEEIRDILKKDKKSIVYKGRRSTKKQMLIGKIFRKIPKTMIDYAITEKMKPRDILIIKGEFGWSDVGSWNDLHKRMLNKADSKGNLVKGNWMGVDTTHSLVYTTSGKMVATIGLDDMVIVDTKDALLVCPRGRSQDVKAIIEKLKKNKKRKKYL
ncbi:MAG: NTP transferase domain-containing protein [Candidatus Moranbacteria bacterium]|nr:NTP transferase domain-containing protein [Candidatus Moranbacteria bacterium]